MIQLTSIQPVADRVIIKKDENEEKTSGGLFIPPTAKNKKNTGTILAVGPVSRCRVGDKVYFLKKNELEVETEQGKVFILPEVEILAVI